MSIRGIWSKVEPTLKMRENDLKHRKAERKRKRESVRETIEAIFSI